MDLTGLATALTSKTYDAAVSTADAAGNTAVDATTNEFEIDTVLPAIPVAGTLVTTDPTPVITGSAVVIAGDVVTVLVGGASYTVVPDVSDNWTLDLGAATPDSVCWP